ncbi:MAG: DUF4926 domain-containing protein [Symploca sp. SIO1B1]|nr:DUF4926 domain-containing protein [Symploca sp. SIO1C2]NER48448.1 DUF4926 domain-containing protein [Symploca sp. SIO1A3]NER93157.1 DUF4926 domain-containing protein [Symploca sp. SIO1B1]
MSNINEYDLVALTENVQAVHKETRELILLRKGQLGTVLMEFNTEAYLVDFADAQGCTYAMETISADKLMLLFDEPVAVYA